MSEIKTISDRKRTLIFVNIVITCIATSLLQTALTTALPPIIEDFRISVTTGQWLTSAYSLVMAIMMPLTAFLVTRVPTRKLYLGTILLFTAGTGICVFAPNFLFLMIGRVFQACSNGITSAMGQVILLSMYPLEKRGTIMGWYGLSAGAAPVIAPTLAGALVDVCGWRMIFVCTFIIMIVSLIYAFLVMEDVLDTVVKRFDTLSFLYSALAFGGMTLGLGNISGGFLSLNVCVPLMIGLLAVALFIYRQFHTEQPLLELRTFKHFDFSLSVINSMLFYLIMMGGSLILPLYVQTLLGYSATVSGLVTLPGSLAMALVSPVAGRIYDRLGMKRLAVAGSSALFIGALGMCFVTLKTPLLWVALLNVIRNVAIGCLMMPFVTWGVSSIDPENTADGTTLINSLRTIAGAVGTALFVGIMSSVAAKSADTLGNYAGIHGMHVSFAAMAFLAVIMIFIALIWIKPGKNGIPASR
ncbi:MAG: MDR family MFS transporter [Clostridia bacterium]